MGAPARHRQLLVLALIVVMAMSQAAADDDREEADMPPGDTSDPRPAAQLDLERYSGMWYEIARVPNSHQKRCARDVTAHYTPLENGKLEVVNSCTRSDGRRVAAAGVARLEDDGGPASRLEVRFAPGWLSWLPWVWSDYWVLDVDPGYEHALVGTPDQEMLWVLARSPQIDAATYMRMKEAAREQGFDADQLVLTPQTSGGDPTPIVDMGDKSEGGE